MNTRPAIALLAALTLAAAPAKKDIARATAMVDQAVALFRAERYTGAAELFLEAYAITDLPVQLRNAAKAFQLGGDEARALEAWRKYAGRSDVSASEHAEAVAEIARIEEKQTSREAIRASDEARQRAEDEAARERAAREAAEERTKTATLAETATKAAEPPQLVLHEEPKPPTDETASKGPYYLAGGSAVLGITAVILFAHSGTRLNTLDEALSATDPNGKINGVDQPTAVDRLNSINTERDAARFILGAGIATLATAAVWWLIDR